MEEDISKLVRSGVEVFEEERDNWTFVSSEDISKNNNTSQQEDSSDNYSEQGSDSGSSIVVIDSSTVPVCDTHSVLGVMSHQELLKTDEGQAESYDDNISCSSQQSNNEFLKECSPYEEMEQPDSWDCDNDVVSDEMDSSLVSESLCCSRETIVDCPIPENACAEGESQIPLSEESTLSGDSSKIEEHIPKENEVTEEAACEQVADEMSCLEEQQSVSDETDAIDSPLICDNLPSNPEGSKGNEVELDDPENLVENADIMENVYVQDCKIDGEQIMDDESEDETWDLSFEALVNANSLASSLSSLIQQPSSPSPAPIPLAEGLRFALVKPDLLEEANRIEELDLMDYSTVTNPDLPAELVVSNIVRDRHYVHHPNQRLNVQLSYIVAFVLAAVVGFALGHIIGLSDNFPSRCNLSEEVKQGSSRRYEGWTEEDWRTELQRLSSYNEELSRALKDLSVPDSTSCRFDFQVNELITENWDLKQSIGRIRYGKPTRSVEDRDTINRLQTENQELRATVGKLRYRCGQPLPNPQIQIHEKDLLPKLSGTEPLWKTLGELNLTSSWNHLINYSSNRTMENQLNGVKESASDLIRLIGLRRNELINLTRENSSPASEKMEERFKKSAQKTLNLLERVNKQQESFAILLEDVENRLEKIRSKLETHWSQLLQTYSETSNIFDTSENTKSLNADWFFSMGQHREKMRRTEKQSDWMFDRARNRELERRSRKFQAKHKKQKPFQGNSWNHYSS